MNRNGKNALVIAGSAAAAGAVIYGVTKLIGVVKSRSASKEPKAEAEKSEQKPVKVETETE